MVFVCFGIVSSEVFAGYVHSVALWVAVSLKAALLQMADRTSQHFLFCAGMALAVNLDPVLSWTWSDGPTHTEPLAKGLTSVLQTGGCNFG